MKSNQTEFEKAAIKRFEALPYADKMLIMEARETLVRYGTRQTDIDMALLDAAEYQKEGKHEAAAALREYAAGLQKMNGTKPKEDPQ